MKGVTEVKRIGFIGLGVMGLPMCRNVMKAGYPVVAFDVRQSALEEVVSAGAERGASAADVAGKADVVITMLPDSPQVKDAVLGPGGVLEGAKPGTIIIDMSSIAPAAAMEVAEAANKLGVRMLDAPVSGGEPGAVNATLSVMVGGRAEDFAECYDLLSTMGRSVVHVGDVGAGNTVKLCNQIIVALNIAAVGEAFALGAKAGVNPEVIFNAIKGGLAGSHVMDAKIPMVLERNFKPGFRIDLHVKDLTNALLAGKDVGAPLPFTGLVIQIMQALKVQGKGVLDHGALMTFFEQLADTEIRSQEQ